MHPEPIPSALPPSGHRRTALTVGLAVGGTVLFFGLVGGMFLWMRATAEDKLRHNNAKMVSLSLENYSMAYGTPPGPSIDSKTQNPSRQLDLFGMAEKEPVTPPTNPPDRISWRAMILPFMEREDVYRRLDFNKPWNDPANLPATSLPLRSFGDPLDPVDANTRFRVFYDNGALFDTDPKKRVSLEQIPDGAANTIMFAESADRVPWAQFNEHAYTPTGTPPQLGHPNRSNFLVGMADGSVRVVKKSVSANTLRAAITRAGGESLGSDW